MQRRNIQLTPHVVFACPIWSPFRKGLGCFSCDCEPAPESLWWENALNIQVILVARSLPLLFGREGDRPLANKHLVLTRRGRTGFEWKRVGRLRPALELA